MQKKNAVLGCLMLSGRTRFLLLFSVLVLSSHIYAQEDFTSEARNDPATSFDEPVPGDAQRAFDEAIISFNNGDIARAELLFSGLSQTNTNLAGPYRNLGIIYSTTGRLGKAEGVLLRSITLNSQNPHAYNHLGIVYRKIGRFTDALVNYQKALELSPDLADVHLNMGILYDLYLLKPMKALEHYQYFQALNGSEDKDVRKWIIEVTRRIKRSRR